MPTQTLPDIESDIWSDWLLHRRHAEDTEFQKVVTAAVDKYAVRVLDNANLAGGAVLLDIGSGEGLIPFRAIERVGRSLRVILTDISGPMLRHAEEVAKARGIFDQCAFFEASAENLSAVPDESVDIVTSRATLAYVADKSAALRELFRVLKPGGTLSFAEPIFNDEALFARVLKARVESSGDGSVDQFLKLLHRWKSSQFPDTASGCAQTPLVNFTERDLLNYVNGVGFANIHLELHIDVVPSVVTSWDVFIGTSPHPLAPTLREIMAEQFTSDERQFFENTVRPSVESGANTSTDRVVFLKASKPRSTCLTSVTLDPLSRRRRLGREKGQFPGACSASS